MKKKLLLKNHIRICFFFWALVIYIVFGRLYEDFIFDIRRYNNQGQILRSKVEYYNVIDLFLNLFLENI